MSRTASIIGLILVLTFTIWWRCHTVGPAFRQATGFSIYPVGDAEVEPLDCDEAIYGYIGFRMNQGAKLYEDLTENKPPGGYWLYRVATRIGGREELTIRLMPIPYVLGTIGMIWWIVSRLGGPLSALVAAFAYAILSTSPALHGNGANMEHAINFFAVASLGMMVWIWPNRDGPWWGLELVGMLVGLATLIKPVAGLHGLIYAIAIGVRAGRSPRGRRKDLGDLATGFCAIWFLAGFALSLNGTLETGLNDFINYARALASDTPADPKAPPFFVRWIAGNADPQGVLPPPFGKTDYVTWWAEGTWPVWLAVLPFLAILLGRKEATPRKLVALWTLSAWFQVAMPRLFWQHYYLLPTPGVAIILGLGLADSFRARSTGRKLIGSLGIMTVIVSIFGMTVFQVRDYLMVPPSKLVRTNGGPQWMSYRHIGRVLRERASLWESPALFVWGWQSQLYFYSGLPNATPQVFTDDFLKSHATTDHPQATPRIERIIHDLEQKPPAIIMAGYPPFPKLYAFLRKGYLRTSLVPQTQDGAGLWIDRSKFAEFETYDKPSTAR